MIDLLIIEYQAISIAISNRSVTLALITIFWVIEQEISYRFLYLHYSSIKSRANKYAFRILIYPCILRNELLFEQPDCG